VKLVVSTVVSKVVEMDEKKVAMKVDLMAVVMVDDLAA
jgi:hypothetical protein